MKDKIHTLLISAQDDLMKSIKKQLPVERYEVRIRKTRDQAIREISIRDFNCIIVDSTFRDKDICVLLKLINTTKKYGVKSHVFFASEAFEDFQWVFDNCTDFNVKLLQLPAPVPEIVEIINANYFPEDYKGRDDSLNINLNFLKIFIDATKTTVGEMGRLDKIEHEKPRFLDKNYEYEVALRGKIVIESKYFNGSFFICFPKETFLKLVERILGTKELNISSENQDLVEEIANIIYGQAKKIVNESGYSCQMAIPILDKTPKLISPHNIIVIPFKTIIGNFYIKIAPELK